jgi:hypothetical protein
MGYTRGLPGSVARFATVLEAFRSGREEPVMETRRPVVNMVSMNFSYIIKANKQ